MGSDKLSQQWLKQFSKQLKQINEVRFLVQASNRDDLNMMKQLAEDIIFISMPGNALIQEWNIELYPILISQRGIEQ